MAFVNFTKFQEKFFIFVGFNILISEGDPCIYPILTFVVFINLFLFSLTLLSYSIANISNIESATNTMSLLIACLLCLEKLVLFYIYRKKFVQVIWKIKSISTKDIPTEESILEAENKKVIFITKLFVCIIAFSFLFTTTIPLTRMAFSYWQFGQVSYVLPFNGLYPFDWENTSVFLLTFLWHISVSVNAATFTASIDTLFIAIVFNLCAQLQILNRKIELLKVDVTQDLEKEVGKIISHHQLILDLIKDINVLFRPILFVQFLMGAIQLCTVCFQMVVLYKDPQILFYGSYLILCLLQLFISCYCGDRIQSESGAFANHIYLGYWYTFPPKIARCLYLSMMRSQRPGKLEGYFFEANLVTFNAILTTTYSYMTFLRSMLQERSD